MQSPIAVPRMPASASGVSTQRSAPKRSRSPAVARKTPPARPTSSPITSTVVVALELDVQRVVDRLDHQELSQRRLRESAAARRARPGTTRAGSRTRARRASPMSGVRLRLGRGDAGAHHVCRLVLDRLVELVAEDAEPAEVALVAAEALVLLLLLDALEIDVRARIVGGRVRRGAVRDGLDERRAAAGARALDRLARRLVAPRARRRRRRARRGSRSRPPCRRAPPRASARDTGVEIAHWLLLQKRMSGACITPAKFAPSWNAPSLVAPSPKNAIAHARSPFSFLPHARPAACGTCVAIGTQIDATL